MKHRIVIPDWLPVSGNTYARMHWAKRKQELRTAQDFLHYYGAALIPRAERGTKRRVHIHLDKGRRGKKDDAGNLDSRSKVIYDALVHNGTLWDDDHAHLEHVPVTQSAPSDVKQTIITITETPT